MIFDMSLNSSISSAVNGRLILVATVAAADGGCCCDCASICSAERTPLLTISADALNESGVNKLMAPGDRFDSIATFEAAASWAMCLAASSACKLAGALAIRSSSVIGVVAGAAAAVKGGAAIAAFSSGLGLAFDTAAALSDGTS